jgi:hypothetical protein
MGRSAKKDLYDLQPVIEWMGLERFIQQVGLDRIIEEIGIDRIMEYWRKKEGIKYIVDRLVAKLSPAQRRELKRLLD